MQLTIKDPAFVLDFQYPVVAGFQYVCGDSTVSIMRDWHFNSGRQQPMIMLRMPINLEHCTTFVPLAGMVAQPVAVATKGIISAQFRRSQ